MMNTEDEPPHTAVPSNDEVWENLLDSFFLKNFFKRNGRTFRALCILL